MLLRLSFRLLRRSTSRAPVLSGDSPSPRVFPRRQSGSLFPAPAASYATSSASSPSLSIWRRKKEMGKEGLIVAKELKRLQTNPVRLERFIKSHVSRLLKSDLVSVVAELQRQEQVFLCMKVRPPCTPAIVSRNWLLLLDRFRYFSVSSISQAICSGWKLYSGILICNAFQNTKPGF